MTKPCEQRDQIVSKAHDDITDNLAEMRGYGWPNRIDDILNKVWEDGFNRAMDTAIKLVEADESDPL